MDDHLPVHVPRPTPDTSPAIGRASALALAAASRGATVLRDTLGRRPGTNNALDLASGVVALTAETVAAAGGAAAAVTGDLLRTAGDRLGPVRRLVEHHAVVPLRTAVAVVEERGRIERRRSEAELDLLLDALVPRVVAALLDRVDLTAVVRERVDLDAVAADIDVDAVAARVDVDAVTRRVDVDAVTRRVDVDEIAARLDVDAVAARIDIEAVIDRIDLEAITEEVLDSIDLPSVIRQSTGAMASETVVDVRLQGIEADQAVSRFVDRLLRRRTRRTEGPRDDGDTEEGT